MTKPLADKVIVPSEPTDVVERLQQYRQLKYIGDCKCGNCQLVPLEFLIELEVEIRQLRMASASPHTVSVAERGGAGVLC